MTRFAGFTRETVPVPSGAIAAWVGGDGPPLLLLHGYPQTHLMWHATAPLLAERFTVVATDLTGYGDSHRPTPSDDHAPHAKRAMAADQVAAMAALGHERFAVCGHDRGGRVAYRMALDRPEVVTRLAVLDIVPTLEVWDAFDGDGGLAYWHWFFLAQPNPLPEKLILGDPDAFFGFGGALGLGSDETRYPPDVMAEYRRRLDDADGVRAMCEDYRAGATVDREHDGADHDAGRRIGCPVLALWGAKGFVGARFDVLGVWRRWADDVSGRPVDASHFLAEDEPEAVASELASFLAG